MRGLVCTGVNHNFPIGLDQFTRAFPKLHSGIASLDEFAMDTYEIRIIRKDIKSPDIYFSPHISDHAAVRRARNLAVGDAFIEVWRGATCVYSGTLAQTPTAVATSQGRDQHQGG